MSGRQVVGAVLLVIGLVALLWGGVFGRVRRPCSMPVLWK